MRIRCCRPGTPIQLPDGRESERLKWRRLSYVEAASDSALELNRAMARRSLRLVGALHDAGVPHPGLERTPSTGSCCLATALHREIGLLVAAGLDEMDAIGACTRATTRSLGLQGRGTIEVGQRADVALLEARPSGGRRQPAPHPRRDQGGAPLLSGRARSIARGRGRQSRCAESPFLVTTTDKRQPPLTPPSPLVGERACSPCPT